MTTGGGAFSGFTVTTLPLRATPASAAGTKL
jgi:hypothetical protein